MIIKEQYFHALKITKANVEYYMVDHMTVNSFL